MNRLAAAVFSLPLLAASWLALASVAMAAETAMPDAVLIVYGNQRPVPANIIIDDTLRKVVSGEPGRPVEIFSEFLDVERFATPAYVEAQAEFLHRKYGERNIRVIVAVAPPALQFMLDHRDRILPGAPVVHLGVPRDQQPNRGLPPEFVGATVDHDPMATFELALRLQPAAKRLVIVTGAADLDRIWVRRIRDAVGRLADRLEVEYLAGLPTAEVLRRLGALSRDTIVYTPGYFADGTGLVITPRQSVEQMAAASTAPLYGPHSTFLGTGAVGGYMSPFEDQAKQAGAIVVRLLNGTAPAAIPASSMPNVAIVDWRQLRRWGIDENLLPAGSIVRFKLPSVWEQYRWYVIGTLIIVAIQAAMIAGLLLQRARRRRAEKELAQQRNELAHLSRVSALGQLSASIAHELNQPLATILNNAEAARKMLAREPVDLAELREICNDIVTEDHRAANVIRRLRTLFQRGDMPLQPLDMNELIRDTLALLHTELLMRHVMVVPDLALSLPIVEGGRVQLQQVLLNLFVNAADAMEGNALEERKLVIRTDLAGADVRICVADRGPGVAAADLKNVFEPFWSSKPGGMGMGLAICRSIVSAHRGTLTAANNPERGATFCVTLPVRQVA